MKKSLMMGILLGFIFQLVSATDKWMLNPIMAPGETSAPAVRNGIVLLPACLFPIQVDFSSVSGDVTGLYLSKEETGPGSLGLGTFDRLETWYSIRIYTDSGEIIQAVGLTPEALMALKPVIPPIFPPKPVLLDLTVWAKSHTRGGGLSDDAGEFQAWLIITLVQL